MEKKLTKKIFLLGAFLFLISQFLGIITALNWEKILFCQKIELKPISLLEFIFYFFVSTLLFLFFCFLGKIFKKEKDKIFVSLFVLVSLFGMVYFFSPYLDFLSFFLAGFLIYLWLKKRTVFLNNLCFILGVAGIGGTLALHFKPKVIIFLLIILSIYDFIAVYKTKHMVKMAVQMIKSKVILGLIVPPKISDFKIDLRNTNLPGKFLILGGGDVAFPLILCSSLALENVVFAVILSFFALIGVLTNFYILEKQKTKKPIPALPLISFFSILGYFFLKIYLLK